jgi:hypothetical protein
MVSFAIFDASFVTFIIQISHHVYVSYFSFDLSFSGYKDTRNMLVVIALGGTDTQALAAPAHKRLLVPACKR